MTAPRILVDTNVLVRHLTQDHAGQALAAGRLLAASDRGEWRLVVLEPVLAECVFVLESFYEQPRGAIAAALQRLTNGAGIEVARGGRYQDALQRYAAGKLHFVDCLLAACAAAEQIPLASFDRGLAAGREWPAWDWRRLGG